MAVDTMDKHRQNLILDFAFQRIDMDAYEERYNELDEVVDLVHFRYISKYKIIEQPGDPSLATIDEVLNANRTN